MLQTIRIISIILLFPHILGFIWFIDTFNIFLIASGISMIVALMIVGFFPIKLILSKIEPTANFLITLGLIGCVLFGIHDLTLSNGPDIGGFLMRCIVFFLLFTYVREVKKMKATMVITGTSLNN